MSQKSLPAEPWQNQTQPLGVIRKLLSSCSPFRDSKTHMYIFRGFMISHDILYF
jgi:hypothetical protein